MTKVYGRLRTLDSILAKMASFHEKKDFKFIPVAFGCDVHLANETIKNHYYGVVKELEPSVKTMYLRLVEEEVWLQKHEVEQLIEYANNWLSSIKKENSS